METGFFNLYYIRHNEYIGNKHNMSLSKYEYSNSQQFIDHNVILS